MLQDLGLDSEQIQSLTQDRQFTNQIVIRAPATGFILNRNILVGQRFSKGEAFYRIADLTRTWIWADVTAEQAGFLSGGEKATVMLDGKETGIARVTPVLPQFDASARTLRVRLEASNPKFELRPGQFVDLTIKIRLTPKLCAGRRSAAGGRCRSGTPRCIDAGKTILTDCGREPPR